MSTRGTDRDYWHATGLRLLREALRHQDSTRALLRLPGRVGAAGRQMDGLEGFARSLLLASFLTRQPDLDPDRTLDAALEPLVEGLAAGPGVWPRHHARSQTIVEASTIALSLSVAPDRLWEPLTGAQRAGLVAWLRASLQARVHRTNWLLFPSTVGAFLADVDALTPAEQAVVERAEAGVEALYAGDGWYADGRGPAYDYYNSWSFHFYPLLNALLRGQQERLDHLRPRLAAFLRGYERLFAADGSPVLFGRSLTYRFAVTAALAMGALVDCPALPPGEAGALATGCLRHFERQGALDGDRLRLGWYGDDPTILQPYSGSSSPYWASKAFVCLLLAADHPFWRPAARPPREPATMVLPTPGFVTQSLDAEQLAVLHNHGSMSVQLARDPRQPLDALYDRLSYSNLTEPLPDQFGLDNTIALVRGRRVARRGPFRATASGPGWASSRCRPVVAHAWLWPTLRHRRLVRLLPTLGGYARLGVRIDSLTYALSAGALIVHRVEGQRRGDRLQHFGWPVAGGRRTVQTGPDSITVRTQRLSTTLTVLLGGGDPGHDDADGGSVFGPSCVPWVLGDELGIDPAYLVVWSTVHRSDPAPVPDVPSAVRVLPDGSGVEVDLADRRTLSVRFTAASGLAVEAPATPGP